MVDVDDYGAISGMNEWQGKPKYLEKTWPSAALSTTDPTRLQPSWHGAKPGSICWGCSTTKLRFTHTIKREFGNKDLNGMRTSTIMLTNHLGSSCYWTYRQELEVNFVSVMFSVRPDIRKLYFCISDVYFNTLSYLKRLLLCVFHNTKILMLYNIGISLHSGYHDSTLHK
jgi:hypothetical protein